LKAALPLANRPTPTPRNRPLGSRTGPTAPLIGGACVGNYIMSDRADDLRLQIEAYNRLLGGAPASVAQYYLATIRKIEAELEKIQDLERHQG
jgi:hypothetical protein